MNHTFTDLPDMGSTYLVGIGLIVLYFVILEYCVLLYNDLHHFICHAFGCTKCDISFNQLNLRTLAYMNQAAWLRQHRCYSCIRDIIYVDRIFNKLPWLQVHENPAINESSI